jgi:hypothetical protein
MTLAEQSLCSKNASATRPDQAETAPLVLCHACGAEARDRDRFCRRCGSNLVEPERAAIAPVDAGYLITSSGQRRSISPYVTSPLTQTAANHRVSGALLASITKGVSANLAVYPINRVARRAIIALISIPIWLLIILLSPLDAYFTAKAIAGQS